ncbi:hypothetical protein H8959_021404 [Pygathrix nigripes]
MNVKTKCQLFRSPRAAATRFPGQPQLRLPSASLYTACSSEKEEFFTELELELKSFRRSEKQQYRGYFPAAWSCFQPGHCVKSESVVPPNYSEGTLPYSYNLCVAHTGKTEFNFLKCSEQLSSGQDILCGDSSRALFPLCNSSELASHQDSKRRCSPTGREMQPKTLRSHTSQRPADATN